MTKHQTTNARLAAADCSGPSMVRAARTAFSLGAKAIVADVTDAGDAANIAKVERPSLDNDAKDRIDVVEHPESPPP